MQGFASDPVVICVKPMGIPISASLEEVLCLAPRREITAVHVAIARGFRLLAFGRSSRCLTTVTVVGLGTSVAPICVKATRVG